jgi:large conductance mechanosensitive channel
MDNTPNPQPEAKPSLWSEFLNFALKGNAIDLAIAVVLGGAFAKITTSIVNDLVMPLLNPLIPNGDWRNLVIGSGVRLGSLIGALLDFMIISMALFLVVRMVNRMRREKPQPNPTNASKE